MLALEALLSAVRTVPVTVSDPGVALAKLTWWQQEVERAVGAQPSQHPLVRALAETGVLESLSPDVWRALVLDLAAQVDRPAASDLFAWRERQLQSAGREMALWIGLLEPGSDPAALAPGGASVRVLSLIGQVGRGGGSGWLPLDLVARHGVPATTDHPPASGRLLAALSDLAAEIGEWRESADAARPRSRFLAVRDELARRRLQRLRRNPGRALSDRGAVGDLFAAWATARRHPLAETASV
jgi:phytoene synthase